MKLQIFSDIHLEFEDYVPDVSQADVVILAGDIWVGKKGVDWALESFQSKPVIYVLGNHEYWKHAHPKLIHDLQERTKNTNVHVLEKDFVTINGVNFFGATMWTDYNLYDDKQAAILVCWQMLNDYKRIRTSPNFGKFSPSDSVRIHNETIIWLTNELKNRKNEKNIVITHHAPNARSLQSENTKDILNAAYASHLDAFIQEFTPALWVHGHVHKSNDYMIGSTRVISNAKGNPYSRNSYFKDIFIIEI